MSVSDKTKKPYTAITITTFNEVTLPSAWDKQNKFETQKERNWNV